jgi:hypothetical protein
MEPEPRATATPVLSMPQAQSVPLSTHSFLPWNPSPPSYANIAQHAFKDPNLCIPMIEVKVPSPKKRCKPLPLGRYLPPMAPLAAQLAAPSHLTSPSLSTLPIIINLTEELVTSTPDKKESRENQAEMSDGMPKLWCKFRGRMTTRGHVMQTRESK